MGKIDDLHTLVRLIKEFDLPVSPIMEYAIKERERQYSEFTFPAETDVLTKEPDDKHKKRLSDYIDDFASLSVAVSKGRKLPHKAILLLGIMVLIEDGELTDNVIPLDKVIAEAFIKTWNRYFNSKAPSVWTPFYHLKGEEFWHFKSIESNEKLEMMLSFGGTPSIGKMRPVIKYAYFDDALYELMIDKRSRDILKKVLIDNYLS